MGINPQHRRMWDIESVQVSTLVSIPARERLRAKAKKSGMGIGQYLREMIARELMIEDALAGVTAKPVMKAPKAQQQHPDGVVADSVIGLIGRGFTPSQIAAMRRMPYRDVMAAMGREIDAVCGSQGKNAP
jgi:hypothetical protein